MLIGLLTLEFNLHGNESLKGKRRVSNSLKQKIRNRFNVSVIESARQEDRNALVLTVASVARNTDKDRLLGQLEKAARLADIAADAELVYEDIEIVGV